MPMLGVFVYFVFNQATTSVVPNDSLVLVHYRISLVFLLTYSLFTGRVQGLWSIEYLNTGRAGTAICKQIGGRP